MIPALSYVLHGTGDEQTQWDTKHFVKALAAAEKFGATCKIFKK